MSDIFADVEGVLKEMEIEYRDGGVKKHDPAPAKAADRKTEEVIEKIFITPSLKKSGFGGLSQKEDPRGTIDAINAAAYKKRLEPFYVGFRSDLDNVLYVSTFVHFSEKDKVQKWATVGVNAKNYKL